MFNPFRARGKDDPVERFEKQEVDQEKLKNLELEKSDFMAMTLAFFQVIFPPILLVIILFGLGIWLFTKFMF